MPARVQVQRHDALPPPCEGGRETTFRRGFEDDQDDGTDGDAPRERAQEVVRAWSIDRARRQAETIERALVVDRGPAHRDETWRYGRGAKRAQGHQELCRVRQASTWSASRLVMTANATLASVPSR